MPNSLEPYIKALLKSRYRSLISLVHQDLLMVREILDLIEPAHMAGREDHSTEGYYLQIELEGEPIAGTSYIPVFMDLLYGIPREFALYPFAPIHSASFLPSYYVREG